MFTGAKKLTLIQERSRKGRLFCNHAEKEEIMRMGSTFESGLPMASGKSTFSGAVLGVLILLVAQPWQSMAQDEKPGFFKKIFSGRQTKTTEAGQGTAAPVPDTRIADPTVPFAAVTPVVSVPAAPMAAPSPVSQGAAAPSSGLPVGSDIESRFPSQGGKALKPSKSELGTNQVIEDIVSEYQARIDQMEASDLGLGRLGQLPTVPVDFEAKWAGKITGVFWPGEKRHIESLANVYAKSLTYSNQIKVFSEIPLIRETGLQEAKGEFDFTAFAEARAMHTDEPTSSRLTTGETGRFLENRREGEAGIGKKFLTGSEVRFSDRLSTLDNNSDFLDPNPQTGSEGVLSVVHPLLRGAGTNYQQSKIKIAKLDAGMGIAELVRQVESHLLEVNRAYWTVYLSRAAFVQRQALVEETRSVVGRMEDRKGVDPEATRSELLRATSSLKEREATLIRGEMAVRNAEEHLRMLVNDPDFALGTGGEIIPATPPLLGGPRLELKTIARAALESRAEVLQAVYSLQAATIRSDVDKSDLKPKLNAIGEVTLAGNDGGRDVRGAFNDQVQHGTGWLAGLSFESSLERNSAKARNLRRQHEIRQQTYQLRTTIDTVLMEAVVSYREVMTAYRDMQGKYQAVLASREELRALNERLDLDAGEDKTVGYQLQLILDSIERNQMAEEEFLVSVVAYNTSLAYLERAKGTFIQSEDLDILRNETGEGKGWFRMDSLELRKSGDDDSAAGAK